MMSAEVSLIIVNKVTDSTFKLGINHNMEFIRRSHMS